MAAIGFSTGAIAQGNFRAALELLEGIPTVSAVELSALRQRELPALVAALESLALSRYTYVSVHAPSRYPEADEESITGTLLDIVKRYSWNIIVHPTSVYDASLWRRLGEHLLLENLDRRNNDARTAPQLAYWFEQFPEARLCFDIGHARQIDPTLYEAKRILDTFGSRLAQIHISHVNVASRHERISYPILKAFERLWPAMAGTEAIILESNCNTPDAARHEIKLIYDTLQAA